MTDMKLLEYKGEELLKDFGIPNKNGVVVGNAQDVPCAIKELKRAGPEK